jgi:hypothetical protein
MPFQELEGLPDLKTWNIELLFREVCALDVKALNFNELEPLAGLEAVTDGVEMAKKVLLDAKKERFTVKRVNHEVHHPGHSASAPLLHSGNPQGNILQSAPTSQAQARHQKPPRNIASVNLSYDNPPPVLGCPNCADLKAADRCVLTVSRKRISEAELNQLKGALFTCAETHDVFQTGQKVSMDSGRQQDNSKICTGRRPKWKRLLTR